MKSYRNVRILPLALASIICLVSLKILGLVLDGGYIFNDRAMAQAQASHLSWAQEMLNFPGGKRDTDQDITGSVEPKKEETKADAKSNGKSEAKSDKAADAKDSKDAPKDAAKDAAKDAGGPMAPRTVDLNNMDPNHAVSASERAILERLQERRQELDARAREIDIRENLLKAAEKRIESKVEEIKATEARIGVAKEQKSEADAARFKGIVTMYEAMKPKDAAKIFDRLEMPVLIEVATQMAPRKLSDVIGLMQTDAAERLTVEMARRAGGDKTAVASDLPKIEGKPTADNTNANPN